MCLTRLDWTYSFSFKVYFCVFCFLTSIIGRSTAVEFKSDGVRSSLPGKKQTENDQKLMHRSIYVEDSHQLSELLDWWRRCSTFQQRVSPGNDHDNWERLSRSELVESEWRFFLSMNLFLLDHLWTRKSKIEIFPMIFNMNLISLPEALLDFQ